MRVQGWDISINHGAIVELEDGVLSWIFFWTDRAASASKLKHSVRLDLQKLKKKHGDKHSFEHARLSIVRRCMFKVVTGRPPPDFVAIEDYAMARAQGAHQIGEIGGAARAILWTHGIRYRTIDPYSVKMFAAHDGGADKLLVEEAVSSRWGLDFSKYNPPPPKNPKKKQDRQTSEDLCDATTLAKIVEAEALLRSGEISLKDLEHDKERQVFNRTTKSFPVNILGREWIHNPTWKKSLARELRASLRYIKECAA